MSEEETPDWSKPFSRWNAPYWAMKHGIAAALEATEWKVLCAIYQHVPNVRPGKDRLEQLAGVSTSSVKRARKALKAAGLIDFSETLVGGFGKNAATHYTVADIRHKGLAETIVARLTGVMVNPVHGEPGPSWTPTGVIVNPHRGHGEPGTGAMMNPKVHNLSSQESSQEKSEGAAVPPASEAGVSLGKTEAGTKSSDPEARPTGPQGQGEGTQPSEPKAQLPQTSVEPKPLLSSASATQASEQTNVRSGKVSGTHTSEGVQPRGKANSRGAGSDTINLDKERVRADACKSMAHMEAYLTFGAEALPLMNEERYADVHKLKPSSMNWRQFFVRDEAGNVLKDDVGRPLGIEKMTATAFAGWYWFTVCYYYNQRGRQMCHPGSYSRLTGRMKNALKEWGAGELFDRMATLGQNYDVMMSLKRIFNEWPDETSIGNSLVDSAYAQWVALSEEEKLETMHRVRAR